MAKCFTLSPWCEAPATFPSTSSMSCCSVIIVFMSEKLQKLHGKMLKE